jgi:tRNA threonylcarbamoyl adenosine modification protein YeaZ
MKILAIEYSSSVRGVAVYDSIAKQADRAVLAAREVSGSETLPPTALIDQVLRTIPLTPAGIDGIAVGLGPGSYTGIRLAIAAAQGWQLGRDTPVMGLSSASVLAQHAWEQNHRGPLAIVINALRGEFYLARYLLGDQSVTQVEDLRLAAFAEVDALHQAEHPLAGPDITAWFERGFNLAPPASTLARLAAAAWRPVPAEELQPIYLRPATFVKAPPTREY